MYQDGRGFVPDEYIEAAKVLVLGQNPGTEEELQGVPFVGPTGQEMEARYFSLAGLRRKENVSIANVLRCRWQHGDKLPPEAILKPAMEQCMKVHYRPPKDTVFVVAQGGLAWRALGGPGKVSEWRGYLKP